MTFQRTRPPPAGPLLSDDDHYLKYGFRRTPGDAGEPLINRVTNAWKGDHFLPQTKEEYYEEEYPECCCDLGPENPCLRHVHQRLRSRKLRRTIAVILFSVLALYVMWKRYLLPHLSAKWAEDNLYMAGLDKENGGFGTQMPNPFSDYTMVETLDVMKVPGGDHDPEGKRRLIFVGDIHGCNAQFEKLMHDVIKVNPDTDHVIATGDIVGKGPEPAAVIDSLRGLRASVVRGNWDDRISITAKSYRPRARAQMKTLQSDAVVALQQLSSDHLRYLDRLPLVLHVPAIRPPSTAPPSLNLHITNENLTHSMKDDIYVVHAGLVPGIPISRQDPYGVMNMRAIHPFTHVPSANRQEGVAWEKIWNWFQTRVAKGKKMPFSAELEEASVVEGRLVEQAASKTREQDLEWAFYDPIKEARDKKKQEAAAQKARHQGSRFGMIGEYVFGRWLGSDGDRSAWRKQRPKHIVYGHDSKRGLMIRPWTKGIDTGCVNGEQLTALIVDAWGRQDIVSVDCGSLKKADN